MPLKESDRIAVNQILKQDYAGDELVVIRTLTDDEVEFSIFGNDKGPFIAQSYEDFRATHSIHNQPAAKTSS